ncbi:uncharacterized protein LOC132902660 [Amyelois transitella]|uniref:uncharacterized protein LOC132902660 n=1 Tax=Amyelois transitella TaxID=680683 RepID=UPI002990779E|nr:uncharacterized protein LOC132902660 [Amyelois transitella]
MKLIITFICIINFFVFVNSNEQFIFPPKFQTPGTFVSEGSLYLPPESHTPIPYFPVNKFGSLPFPYLPPAPTGTKSPIPFPSPFPILLSSTRAQHFDDDDDDDKGDDERKSKPPMSTPRPPFPYTRNNRTENLQEQQTLHKRDMRQIQKPMHYQQPIDRVDVRVPNQFPSGFSTPSPINQKPTPRSMIISDTHRNDNIFDQLKAGSSQGGVYVPPLGGFISSTTEPAIPILRLSNEMDLDGSFSYEALGADQTHYVQHSHMENQGTEKEEQVVEGSYSYVGDNGQTYTVHYVADSNGFRASGDHLPVAPPIPEIIQRAIQYNLAEEAKKPPHLKSWQPDEHERDYNEIHDKNQRFAIPPPPRSLFTGRTPEAFSYDISQRSNTQNNLEAAASSQTPVKTVDFVNNQQTNNAGTITPQVTFLASQGAHVPSANNPQQTVSRMFTNDKSIPSLPQLVNYEADDSNKALWRWQYGLSSNNHMNNVNQAPEKNSISRSSGDDVVINFNDMTPDQYSKMLQNQISSATTNTIDNNSPRNLNNFPPQQLSNNLQVNDMQDYKSTPNNQRDSNFDANYSYLQEKHNKLETTTTRHLAHLHGTNIFPTTTPADVIPNKFVTQEYNYEDISYEPRRIKASNQYTTTKPSFNNRNYITNDEYNKMNTPSYSTQSLLDIERGTTFVVTQAPTSTTTSTIMKFTDFISPDNKDSFKPIVKKVNEDKLHDSKEIIEDSNLANNIFLKNLLKPKINEPEESNKINENTEKQMHKKVTAAETKSDKVAKYINIQNKPYNDIKSNKKQPIDISEIINYITMKNHFESSKLNKVKNKPQSFDNRKQKTEMQYANDDDENERFETYSQKHTNNGMFNVYPQIGELRGNIKNYKVLQRNNNLSNGYDSNQLKRELVPPPVKLLQSQNLPPLGRAGPSTKSYLPPIYV